MITDTDFKIIPLAELRESKLNPRHHFDPQALAELTESVKAKGILQPLVVRQNGAGYELVAGARRYRAAKAAGLDLIPCMVRALTDVEVLEIMVIENGQRTDIHPLEEAEGYKQLLAMEKGGRKLDAAGIAARVGRSVKYIYDRMKLCHLIKEAKDLFLEDKITAGHAILLARLSPAEQKMVIGTAAHDYIDGRLFVHEALLFADEDLAPGGAVGTGEDFKAISVRELQAVIDEHVRFDKTAVEPLLFPETADVLHTAQEQAAKVIQITRDCFVRPEAKEGNTERILCVTSWTRADGKHGSKTCEASVIGVVVVGPGRGESFPVCTDKKGCTVHWAKEIKARAQRESGKASGGSAKDRQLLDTRSRQEAQYEAQHAREEAERNRWAKAVPVILTALAELVKKASPKATGLLARIILDDQKGYGSIGRITTELAPSGATAEDLVRRVAFLILSRKLQKWDAPREFPKLAKACGLDVKPLLGPDPSALSTCTVCDAKGIDPKKHLCTPAALKKAKKKLVQKNAKAKKKAA